MAEDLLARAVVSIPSRLMVVLETMNRRTHADRDRRKDRPHRRGADDIGQSNNG
jgi:hypothetical protein